MPGLLSLDLLADISQFIQSTLWVIALMVLFAAFMVYLLAYVSRIFEYLKMQESRVFDAATLDFVHRVFGWVWIGMFLILLVFIASLRWTEARGLLIALIDRFPAVLFVVLTLFAAAVLVRALRRFGSYLRGELKAKPTRVATPRLWGATELFLKYLIVGVALLVAFVGAVDILPDWLPEKQSLLLIRQGLATPSTQLSSALAIAIVGVIVALGVARFSDSVFEDFKVRQRKHGPHVLDQFKGLARLAIYAISFVGILFLELSVFLSSVQVLMIAVSFVVAALGVFLVAFDSLRNAFAGIALMMADPFSVGDRVKVGEDLVGDVDDIALTMTRIRTGKGEVVTLPNRSLLAMSVLNFTRSKHQAIFVDVAVGWDVPHETVEQTLLEAAKRTPGILEVPPPQVFGKDVEGNALVHQLLAYTDDPNQMKQVKSALLYTIQDLFREKNVRALASSE